LSGAILVAQFYKNKFHTGIAGNYLHCRGCSIPEQSALH
jgi:hypothetical protein